MRQSTKCIMVLFTCIIGCGVWSFAGEEESLEADLFSGIPMEDKAISATRKTLTNGVNPTEYRIRYEWNKARSEVLVLENPMSRITGLLREIGVSESHQMLEDGKLHLMSREEQQDFGEENAFLDGGGAMVTLTEYEYDDRAVLQESMQSFYIQNMADTQGRTGARTKYDYDTKGRVARELRINFQGKVDGAETVTDYDYSVEDNKEIETITAMGQRQRVTTTQRNRYGNTVKKTIIRMPGHATESSETIEYEYNQRHQLVGINTVQERGGSKTDITEVRTLDRQGRLLKRFRRVQYSGSDNLIETTEEYVY